MAEFENEEKDMITLTDEDCNEIQCEFLDTVELNDKLYCVVEPIVGSEDYEEGSCYIFNITENADGTVDLTPIEDEKLLDDVFQKFLENNAADCSGDCSGCSGCEDKK